MKEIKKFLSFTYLLLPKVQTQGWEERWKTVSFMHFLLPKVLTQGEGE